jgi:hypothetical protein
MPIRSQSEAEAWERQVMQRLYLARSARGLSLREAGIAAGLGSVPKKLEWAILESQNGSAHLRLDQLLHLAVAYRVDVRDLLVGWHREEAGKAPPLHPEPMDFPELDPTLERVRKNVRACRERTGDGVRAAAGQALGNPLLGSVLFRLESGAAPLVHMKKLYRLAGYFDVPIEELILSDLTVPPTPTPTPTEDRTT